MLPADSFPALSRAPSSSQTTMARGGHPPLSSLVMAGATHPSGWSNRKQRDEAAIAGREAWRTGEPDLALRIAAAAAAAQCAFPHLELEAVLHPPHAWFDAALARQVMVWLLNKRLLVNRRRIAAVSLMSRETIHRAISTVEERADAPLFEAMLRKAGIQAQATYVQGRDD